MTFDPDSEVDSELLRDVIKYLETLDEDDDELDDDVHATRGIEQDDKITASQSLTKLMQEFKDAWKDSTGLESEFFIEPFNSDKIKKVITSQKRYKVEREIGRGGFAIVYLATDLKLQRQVAIKFPSKETILTESKRRRLLSEAQTIASLDHPNIVPLYESVPIADTCYLVTAYCAGGNLADLLNSRATPLSDNEAAIITLQLAKAIAYAHSRGVLHRDLKPGNVLLDTGNTSAGDPGGLGYVPRLIDFGLARILEDDEDAHANNTTGAIVGTPRYMAPEQLDGTSPRGIAATDVYGLGILLFEMLTGQPPFSGASKFDTLRAVMTEHPIAPRRLRNTISADLEAICLKCLEKKPVKRYETPKMLQEDLERFLSNRPTMARPLGPLQQLCSCAVRNPLPAALTMICMLLAAGTVTGLLFYTTQLRRLTVKLNTALYNEENQRKLAQKQEEAAKQNAIAAKRLVYINQCQEAYRLLGQGNESLMASVLNEAAFADGGNVPGFEYAYLRSQSQKVMQFIGHSGNVHLCQFSHDDRYLISVCTELPENCIRLWDTTNAQQLYILRYEASPVSVSFSQDSSKFYVLQEDGQLRTVETLTGKELTLERMINFDSGKWQFKYVGADQTSEVDSPLVCYVQTSATEMADKTLVIRRVSEAQTVVLKECDHLLHISQSHDGILLAVSYTSKDNIGHVSLLDSRSGAVLDEINCEQSIAQCEFSRDDHTLLLASASGESNVYSYDIQSRTLTAQTIPSVTSAVRIALHPTLDMIGTIILDAKFLGHDDPLTFITPTATEDENEASSHTADWNKRIKENVLPENNLLSMCFSHSGTKIALCGANGLLQTVRLRSYPRVKQFQPHQTECWWAEQSPSSDVIASSGDDHQIWLTKTNGEKAGNLIGHQALVTQASFIANGTKLVSSSFDNTLRVWDVASLSELRKIEGHKGIVRSFAIANDSTIYSCDDTGYVYQWDLASGSLIRSWSAHLDKMRQIVIDPKGEFLLTASNDGFVRKWSTETLSEQQSWYEDSEVHALSIRRDGKQFAAARKDGVIHVYDLPQGQQLTELRGIYFSIRSMDFSADGQTLVTGGEDQRVTLWHLPSSLRVYSFPRMNSQVNCVRFSPDGQSLVAANHSGQVFCWESKHPDAFNPPDKE